MISARITGNVASQLRSYLRGLETAVDGAVAEQVDATAADMRSGVPVRSGELESTIRGEHQAGRGRVTAGEGSDGVVGYVEYGTSKMAAEPFVRPAADKARQQLPRRVRDAARRASR